VCNLGVLGAQPGGTGSSTPGHKELNPRLSTSSLTRGCQELNQGALGAQPRDARSNVEVQRAQNGGRVQGAQSRGPRRLTPGCQELNLGWQ